MGIGNRNSFIFALVITMSGEHGLFFSICNFIFLKFHINLFNFHKSLMCVDFSHTLLGELSNTSHIDVWR